MKSNQLNSNDNPSASSPRDNPCLDRDSTRRRPGRDCRRRHQLPAALRAIPVCGKSFQSGFGNRAGCAARKDADSFCVRRRGGPGQRPKRLEQNIQKFELKFVKAADRRLAATLNTHVAAVTVTLNKEAA